MICPCWSYVGCLWSPPCLPQVSKCLLGGSAPWSYRAWRVTPDWSVVPRVLLFTLFKNGCDVSLFLVTETLPGYHNFWNTIKSGLEITSASYLRSLVCISLGPMNPRTGSNNLLFKVVSNLIVFPQSLPQHSGAWEIGRKITSENWYKKKF